ncbi:MAG: lytic transglycosylase domain-containing protein [Clostridia bacterium]|nr:lytic transglycosylase domain-containing protein [Clostridia bacterium]
MKYFFSAFLTLSIVFVAVFGVNCVYGWLFPVKYQEEISAASEAYGVEEAVIYSIINVESGFDKNAVSSRGAVGLMQLMPSTAQSLAGTEGVDLLSPQENIMLGAKYIAQLANRFDDFECVLAAYNAGPTNVRNWLADERYSEDGKTLKKIPFAETKGYLEKYARNFKYYSQKLKSRG